MKKLLSMILAVILITSAIPVSSSAITKLPGIAELFSVFSVKAFAADYQSGDYSYSISGTNATITKYNGTSTGSVSVPSTLDGYNVTAIGNNAFAGSNIRSVTVPEGVISIDYNAFSNCAYLTTVTLPSTLEALHTYHWEDEGAFYNCSRLNSVTFHDGEKDLTIDNDTFRNCSSLQSITIPGQCVSIGAYCFAGCSALASFTLQKNTDGKTQSIGEGIFGGCSALKTVTLPDTLKAIPTGAFESTFISKFTVQEGVTSIEGSAFKNCAYLTTVTLPSTLEALNSGHWKDEGAFYNCFRLNSVTFHNGEKDLTIDHDTFRNCSSLQSITIPGQCVSIGANCFVGCSVLDTFTLEKNAFGTTQSIGEGIFDGCTKLKNVILPDTLKTIPTSAFNSTAISTFTVQEGVTSIEGSAFKNCAYLTTVTLPSTLEALNTGTWEDEGAFYNCFRLNSVTFHNGEKDLTIDHDTFRNCSSLQSITIPGQCVSIGANCFTGCSVLDTFTLEKNAFGTTQSIGEGIFDGCTKLKNVILPDTLKTIPTSAFNSTAISTFTVQEGVTSIEGSAFSNCANLTTVSLPSTLEALNTGTWEYEGAFCNCTNLASVIIQDGERDLTIEHNTFRNCSALTLIHIPRNTISIGDNAFAGHSDALTICSGSSTGVAKTYADNNGIAFRVCTGHTFTVRYDANDGSVSPTSVQVEIGQSTILPYPQKSGATCLGWATSKTASTADFACGSAFTPTSDTTLYAVWKQDPVVTYTVSFNANGGSVSPESAQVTKGNGLTLPTPSKEFFFIYDANGGPETPTAQICDLQCKGWSTSASATSASYFCEAQFVPSDNTTLYAVWDTAPAVTVTSLKLAQNGYTFLGWSTEKSATTATYYGGESIVLTSNMTLYAVWEKNPAATYTVSYNANGGNVSPTSVQVTEGNSTTLPTPTKSYTLIYDANGGQNAPSSQNWELSCKGWATTASATTANYACGSHFTPTKNTVLYAVWESSVNAKLTTSEPSRDGYTFLGWSDNPASVSATNHGNDTITLTSSKTYYAVWKKIPDITYTVTFNPKGGSVSPESAQVKNGESVTLPKPKKENTITYDANGGKNAPAMQAFDLTCSGWSTNPNATVASYSCGAHYTPTEDTTLYAVWEPSVIVQITSEKPTRAHYEFLGWAKTKDATEPYLKSEDIGTLKGNVTLYAVWKYDGSYDPNAKLVVMTPEIVLSTKWNRAATVAFTAIAEDGEYTFRYHISDVEIASFSSEVNSLNDNIFGIALNAEKAGKTTITLELYDVSGSILIDSCTVPVKITNYFYTDSISMNYHSSEKLKFDNFEPIIFLSEDESIVTVDEDTGWCYAEKKGTAYVEAMDEYGNARVTRVDVSLTFFQWIIYIFFLGWLWF